MSVQPSLTRSSSVKPPVCSVVKFISHSRCQPGSSVLDPVGIGRAVGAHVDRRRRALEHVEVPRAGAEMRDALHGGGAGADDADALVGELVERRTRRVAAGVVVVPAAGVEAVALRRSRCRGCPAASGGAAGRSPSRRSGARIASPRLVRMIQRVGASSQSQLGDLGLTGRRRRTGRSGSAIRRQCSKISGACVYFSVGM